MFSLLSIEDNIAPKIYALTFMFLTYGIFNICVVEEEAYAKAEA
jgi:hypothetical protein